MKQAIVNILNALADRIRPCGHQWERWETVRCGNGWDETWRIFHLVCKKCGRFKRVKSS